MVYRMARQQKVVEWKLVHLAVSSSADWCLKGRLSLVLFLPQFPFRESGKLEPQDFRAGFTLNVGCMNISSKTSGLPSPSLPSPRVSL